MLLDKIREKLSKGDNASGGTGSNGAVSTFDLLYQLSYMSVIAAAGVPRKHIFGRSSQLECSSAPYFRKVELTTNRLGYDYARSCRVVGESVENEEVRGLLLRFSSSLVSGEPEAEFLAREAEAVAKDYENEYGRKLESLKQWTVAYVSLVLSAVLVVVIGLVSTMIWSIGTGFMLGLMGICIGTTAVGVWLIYLMSPIEGKVLHWDGGGERHPVVKFMKVLVPAAAVACIVLVVFGFGVGWVLLIVAVLVFPLGFIAVSNDKKVSKRDVEVGPFLRSLGGVCSAIGTTVKEAIGRLDLEAINALRPEVKRLHTRLVSGIRSKLCWERFIEETGSTLASRSMTMFYDAIELGGEPAQAGYHASLFASRVSLLRAQRRTITSPFRWLCLVMHAAVILLLVFITQVIAIFGGLIITAQESIPEMPGGHGTPSVSAFTSFNVAGLEFMQNMVVPLLIVFTLANALAPTIADGGSKWKVLYDLGITGAVSGATVILVPSMAAALFSGIQM